MLFSFTQTLEQENEIIKQQLRLNQTLMENDDLMGNSKNKSTSEIARGLFGLPPKKPEIEQVFEEVVLEEDQPDVSLDTRPTEATSALANQTTSPGIMADADITPNLQSLIMPRDEIQPFEINFKNSKKRHAIRRNKIKNICKRYVKSTRNSLNLEKKLTLPSITKLQSLTEYQVSNIKYFQQEKVGKNSDFLICSAVKTGTKSYENLLRGFSFDRQGLAEAL